MNLNTSARDDAASAFDALSGETPDEAEAPAGAPEAPPDTEAPGLELEASDDVGAAETPAEKADRARDEAGRFAAKQKEAAAEGKPAPVKPAPRAGERPPPPASELRAPVSLKPTEREAFKTWPKDLQEMVVRRERDQAVALQRNASEVRFGQTMQQVAAPYAQSIQAMGGNVPEAVGNLLRTAHVLQYGTPAQKADVVYGVLSQYGIDLDLVNARMDGKPLPQGAQQQDFNPQALALQIRQSVMQDIAQQRQASLAQRADAEVSSFGSTHPYFEDVRPRMALLMRVAAEEGSPMDMEAAYTLACQSTPDVAALLAKQSRSNAPVASTQRVRAAAGSLRPRPSMPSGQQQQAASRSARDDAEAAWEALSGR